MNRTLPEHSHGSPRHLLYSSLRRSARNDVPQDHYYSTERQGKGSREVLLSGEDVRSSDRLSLVSLRSMFDVVQSPLPISGALGLDLYIITLPPRSNGFLPVRRRTARHFRRPHRGCTLVRKSAATGKYPGHAVDSEAEDQCGHRPFPAKEGLVNGGIVTIVISQVRLTSTEDV